MRKNAILGLAGIVIAGVAFVAGLLVERRFPSLFSAAPNPPTLLDPAEGAVLPNGDQKQVTPYWEFSWSEVLGAEQYQFALKHPMYPWDEYHDVVNVVHPGLNVLMERPRHRIPVQGHTFPEAIQKGWSWRVRAQTRRGWSIWSETRQFDVAELGK